MSEAPYGDELEFREVPRHWCNFVCDYPKYAEREASNLRAILGSGVRGLNVVPQQPLSLYKQSNNCTDRLIRIPDEISSLYRKYRPTPLRRAAGFEQALDTRTHIYYKFEGANLSGSHKLNTAIAQAYYYKQGGIEHLVTGTGAGQWGTAIAYACKLMGLHCTVFMVRASLEQKAQRREMMELFGAEVYASPSEQTKVGRDAANDPRNHMGTLAFATGEALELASVGRRTRFAVGSGENCVLLHQTVIGNEALGQMNSFGEFPDHVIACMGAGSNFGGIGLPFLRAAGERGRDLRLLAAEPTACPKLTRGRFAYEVSDFSGSTPVSRMYTLGSRYISPPIHAGGLRYHGTSPFLSAMYADGLFDAVAIDQPSTLRAGLLFAETEGVLPAPESAHAIAAAVDLCRGNGQGEPQCILINVSGHGLFDLKAYKELVHGTIESGTPNEQHLCASLDALDEFNKPLQVVGNGAHA